MVVRAVHPWLRAYVNLRAIVKRQSLAPTLSPKNLGEGELRHCEMADASSLPRPAIERTQSSPIFTIVNRDLGHSLRFA